jgi:hypothetical protein
MLVEFSVNLVSCFDCALTWSFFWERNFVEALGYISSASLKAHTLAGFSCEEKSMGIEKYMRDASTTAEARL